VSETVVLLGKIEQSRERLLETKKKEENSFGNSYASQSNSAVVQFSSVWTVSATWLPVICHRFRQLERRCIFWQWQYFEQWQNI